VPLPPKKLDPDGDMVRHLLAKNCAVKCPNWACYHIRKGSREWLPGFVVPGGHSCPALEGFYQVKLGMPMAPAVMVGDEIIVQGCEAAEEKVEAAICRPKPAIGASPSDRNPRFNGAEDRGDNCSWPACAGRSHF